MKKQFQIIQEPISDPGAHVRGVALFTVCFIPIVLLLLAMFLGNGFSDWYVLLLGFAFACVLFNTFVWAHYKAPSSVYIIAIDSEYLSVFSGDKRVIYWNQKVSDITDVCIKGDTADLGVWHSLIIRTQTDSYEIWLGRGAGLSNMNMFRNVRVEGISTEQLVVNLKQAINQQ